jgi:Zn-dependent peptidase ImmA (M78 family)/transcriptional regulator with XRE-family HTH domain
MNGELLKKAREIEGLTQQELADLVTPKLTQAAIAKIEQNLLEPSKETAEKIALALRFPIEFFYESSYLDFPLGSLLFRCLKGLKSKDRSQVVQTAWAGVKIYNSMAKRLKMKPSRLPRIAHKDILSAPAILRNALGIEPDKPIRNIINKLENIGVVIISVPYEIHEHDGFSTWVEDRPVIVLSRGKSGDRQKRTSTHEMIHLSGHYSFDGNNLDDIEKEADLLTNEFLLPEETIRQEIKPPVTLSDLADLKERWGVSIQSLVERAFELEIITANQRKYLWKQINNERWRKEEPKYIEPEQPRALQKMAEYLYSKNGKVDYTQLARDTNLPRRIVHNILSDYKGYTGEFLEKNTNVLNFPSKQSEFEDKTDLIESDVKPTNLVNFKF